MGENMKKRLKLQLIMMCIIALCLGLTSCGSNSGTGKGQVTATPTQTTVSQEQTGEVTYPITVTDSYGNEVVLEKEPTKIVSVAPNITEIVYALGAEEKLVARTDYCDYPEEAKKIESIGSLSNPDIEKIVSLEPDLVIASTHFTEENEEKLKELGIPVIGLYVESDMTGVYQIIETMGQALNKVEKATKIVADMKETVTTVTTAVKDLDPTTVYYVVGYGEGGDFTAGGDTFIGNILTLAGGKNIAADVSGWNYSLESLIKADPEVIIVREGEKDSFCKTEGYKELTAVKEDKVYEMDTNLLDRQGNRNAEGLLVIAKLLHPEAFK